MENLNTLAAANLVRLAYGESNGRDDSDGFDAYYNLDTNEIFFTHWTTRFACDKRILTERQMSDLTPEDLAKCKLAMTNYAEAWLKKCTNTAIPYNVKNGSYRGIPCRVSGGRKFKGEGELVGLKTTYFTYGTNYHSFYGRTNGQTAETTKVIIRTSTGDIAEATAKYVDILIDKIDIHPIAEKFAHSVIVEEGYRGNIMRYSSSKNLIDFILEYYKN